MFIQPSKMFWTLSAVAMVAAVTLTCVAPASAADKENVIYSLKGGNDEGFPYGGLIFDPAGNLYGTNCGGGSADYYGTAFKLTPTEVGSWKIDVLHIFTGATDGSCPRAALIRDKAGNLYSTTTAGGNLNFCNGLGCGTVFELSPTSHGRWKETVLYSLTDQNDGGYPYAGLISDAAGHLYGTTYKGGQSGTGVVFELTRKSNGKWHEKVIHTFTGANGQYPYGGLIFDRDGNLYGTASERGLGYGTAFKLTRSSRGWQETKLYSFTYGADGGIPLAGLVMDSQGNLYGTASAGGADGNGLVFELMPSSSGWTENTLYSFNGNNDGRYPHAGVIFDAAGNLYGTNFYGGTVDGTVYELSPGSHGWSETILYSFTGGSDGGQPESGVVFDKMGNLYGTASSGGALGWGCVFRVGRGSASHPKP
jgi:uncharacterized repeat protein (TIGR03803 family)